jgi:hypothetical protein
MNRLKKSVTVRFFSIDAHGQFFIDFVTNFSSNAAGSNSSRILTLRKKKYLVKLAGEHVISGENCFAITAVRERNTWQTKALSNGKITGISPNQGIVGDPYFFLIVPGKRLLLGFTSGPGGSLKSVGNTVLDQFGGDRLLKVKLDLIPKEKEFSTLKEIPAYSSLHFKINSSSFSEVADDAPQLIKDLSAAPYIENNMQLSLDLDVNNSSPNYMSRENVLEIVNYLSEHEGCTVLKVKGVGNNGDLISLDFGNAFLNYRTEISTRASYVEEDISIKVLEAAFLEYFESNFSQKKA